jgi:hypothetical protein
LWLLVQIAAKFHFAVVVAAMRLAATTIAVLTG